MIILFILCFLKILDFVYLFQTKEYRFDRFKAFINDEGYIKVFYLRGFRLPARSLRNYLLVFISFLLLIILLATIISDVVILIALLISPFISFVLVCFSVWLTNIAANIKRQQIINEAKAKIEQSKAVFIGITGSYGKSSVKEFLYHLISQKYQVEKTDENMNTDVGVALSILKNLRKNTQYFIAEVGAYRKGEIKTVCDLIHPTYGILTAISNQHLDLFGSWQNLLETKSELLSSLPKNGKAYVNKDIMGYKKIISRLNCAATTFSLHKNADIMAKNISLNHDGMKATIFYHREILHIETGLIGNHNLLNLLPCIALSLDLNINKEDIIKAIKKLKQPGKKLSLHSGLSGSKILDDSYNSNVRGFIAAIKTAALFPQKKKIILSRGIIELGREKPASYRNIVEELNKTSLSLYTTDAIFARFDRQNNVKIFTNERKMVNYLKSTADNDTLTIIEGRFEQKTIQKLL